MRIRRTDMSPFSMIVFCLGVIPISAQDLPESRQVNFDVN